MRIFIRYYISRILLNIIRKELILCVCVVGVGVEGLRLEICRSTTTLNNMGEYHGRMPPEARFKREYVLDDSLYIKYQDR